MTLAQRLLNSKPLRQRFASFISSRQASRRRSPPCVFDSIERLEDRTLLSAGALDLSFGTAGLVSTDLFGGDDHVGSMAIQDDGKILVAGTTGPHGGTDMFVTRYEADGTLDTSFGVNGVVVANLSSNDVAYSLAIQDDGKIVVAGSTSTPAQFSARSAFLRFNTDGSLDDGSANDSTPGDSFGNADGDGVNGAVLIDVVADNFSNPRSGREQVSGISLQEDGRIVGVGFAESAVGGGLDGDITLIRLNSDGSLDTTFDGDGIVLTDVSVGDGGDRVVVLGNGDGLGNDKIAVGAHVGFENGDIDFALLRYNTDGSLDTSFGTDGVVTTDINASSRDFVTGMAVQDDGKVVLVGNASPVVGGASEADFALVRYNADGMLDSSFGSGGKVITDISGSSDVPQAGVAVQTDGKLVVAGRATSATPGESFDFAVVRYNSDGSLDTSFDGDGIVTTDFPSGGSEETVGGVAIQSDGKIVVAGDTRIGSGTYDVALARYDGGLINTAVDVNQGSVNLANNGVLSVVIRTTETFDAAQVNAATVVLAGANVSQYALEDVDGDGDLDLVLHFRMEDMQSDLLDLYAERLAADVAEDGDLDSNKQIIEAVLLGSTFSSELFQGVDNVEVFLSGKALDDFLAAHGIIV